MPLLVTLNFIQTPILIILMCISNIMGTSRFDNNFKDSMVVWMDPPASFSIAGVIVLDVDALKSTGIQNIEDAKKHEYGHILQQRILGQYYIPFVVIPSVLGGIVVNGANGYTIDDYYKLPWEAWANDLAGL